MSNPSLHPPQDVAVVAIGRNEGQRVVRCLQAAVGQLNAAQRVIYVDSGSTDGSVTRAREMGVVVLELDMGVPFTAARARNLGMDHVRRTLPHVEFIQFLDADCEMLPGWIQRAAATLQSDPRLAGVAGVLRERFPEATIYNRLCDLEWQAPAPGETGAVGGNAMLRLSALAEVSGYNPALIAGEEPELCVRLRQSGWRLWRLREPMALHDADMKRFGQWWRRALRFGHAQTQVWLMHRRSPEAIWGRDLRSTVAWAVSPPLMALLVMGGLGWTLGGWWWLLGLIPLGLYVALALKVYLVRRRCGEATGDAALYAVFVTLAKFPQFLGMLRYLRDRWTGRQSTLVEYKGAHAPDALPAPVTVQVRG